MITVCAWCGKEYLGGSSVHEQEQEITHGMCEKCATRFLMETRSEDWSEFLNRLPGAVIVSTGEFKFLDANCSGLNSLSKSRDNLKDILGGDAIECIYANEPEGCGNTRHCETCAIRILVSDTFRQGTTYKEIPAYSLVHSIMGEKKVRFVLSTQKVGDYVLLRIDNMKEEEDQHQRSEH